MDKSGEGWKELEAHSELKSWNTEEILIVFRMKTHACKETVRDKKLQRSLLDKISHLTLHSVHIQQSPSPSDSSAADEVWY